MTYPYYPQQMPFNKIIPVSNESDINRYTVDFNGTPTYFYNQATNEIFVKQFDMRTGVTNSQRFIRAEVPICPPKEDEKDKFKETFDTFEEKIEALNKRLSALEEVKGGKNAK